MLVSVIVPLYNMEKFVSKTVECLRAQDCPLIEFILINDGSSDKTLQILEELDLGKDRRFRLLTTENRGYGSACNLGLNVASGRYVSIFEPDDLIEKDFYSTLLLYAEKFSDADVIRYNGFFKMDGNSRKKVYSWDSSVTGRVFDADDYPRFWKSHPSVFNGIYLRSFLMQNRIAFCETPQASFQDATFMVSLYYSKPKILVVDEVKYTYVTHPDQSVRSASSKLEFVFRNWIEEKKWLKERNISDLSYYNFKMISQYRSLLEKNKDIRKERILRSVRRLLKNRCIKDFSTVATFKEKISCYMFSFKARRYRQSKRRGA